jgi:hypothetical protein
VLGGAAGVALAVALEVAVGVGGAVEVAPLSDGVAHPINESQHVASTPNAGQTWSTRAVRRWVRSMGLAERYRADALGPLPHA